MSKVELFQGDCLGLMKNIADKSIDMILCDLPYGSTACKWDNVIPFESLFNHYKRIITDRGVIALFGAEPFSSHLRINSPVPYRYDLIWNKMRGVTFALANKQPMRCHENISFFYKKQPTYNPLKFPGMPYICKGGARKKNIEMLGKKSSASSIRATTINTGERFPLSILNFSRDPMKLHPTQKPVSLLEYLIKTYTNEGQTVLDNCMGSGSTGVACVRNGRNFIGMELQEKYFEIAKNRIEDEMKKAENHAESEPFWNLTTGENNVGGINFAKKL